MKVLFVRHGIAEDKETFKGPDLQRPLTEEGRRKCAAAFAGLARLYPDLQFILSSQAVRARETADLLAKATKAKVEESDLLNPGADAVKLLKLLGRVGDRERVAVVGHEPDFSAILSDLVSDGSLRIDVKKASCVDIDVDLHGHGELKAALPPAALIAAGG